MASAETYKSKLHKAQGQLSELKEVLQMAVDADARKDALVEEVRASAKEAREKLDKEREALLREKEFVAREQQELENRRRDLREENAQLR